MQLGRFFTPKNISSSEPPPLSKPKNPHSVFRLHANWVGNVQSREFKDGNLRFSLYALPPSVQVDRQ